VTTSNPSIAACRAQIGIDFGDLDAGAGTGQRRGRTLSDIAVTADNGDLAGHHDIGCAANAVDQRFLAAVFIVELRFGDAVIDVDRREGQQALLLQLVEAVHARRRFLGDALDRVALLGEPAGRLFQALPDLSEEDFLLLRARIGQHVLARFGACAEQDVHRGVAAIVEDHVAEAAIGPLEDLVRIGPVLLERLALDREDRNAGGGDRCRGMVLRREDVAGRPADFGTERDQRLDQHGRLDRHVEGTGNTGALQGLARAEFLAARHEARHLGLGDGDFLAAIIGLLDIGDNEIFGRWGCGLLG
jgi:hypothetical protein